MGGKKKSGGTEKAPTFPKTEKMGNLKKEKKGRAQNGGITKPAHF